MIEPKSTVLERFQWEPQPKAEALVTELISKFVAQNTFARTLQERLLNEAGVRFPDLVDHLAVLATAELESRLTEAGFVRQSGQGDRFVQPEGIFPPVVLHKEGAARLAIKVEDVVDFLAAWNLWHAHLIGGEGLAPMRGVVISREPGAELFAVERHGFRGLIAPKWTGDQSAAVLKHLERFRLRQREFKNDDDGFDFAMRLINAAIAEIGVDYTCDIFFRAEREYWQRRNRAARAQKARQDRLGIGWANHDHHTYRSSRRHFAKLIALHEKLGLVCRERFYAGREAGWGAQVMEQPNTGIITFNDVDLSPDELFGDFAHGPLPERASLGTVGLWCALHGEAILQAGMHHLEAQFDFESLREQLEKEEGVRTMKPFTDFPHLRQAFTEGERWKVADARIDAALQAGFITEQQAQQFREQGAIGSHLENLERNAGFKGFNQTGVSEIIAATDPRKN